MTVAMKGSMPAFAVAASSSSSSRLRHLKLRVASLCRCCSSAGSPPQIFELPDVLQLAEKARITLTPKEVEDFRPKLEQLVDWFGQLQAVDLENIMPALRADNVSQRPLREDVPLPFKDRDAMLAAVPEAEGPFVKVPKILNENME